MSSAVEIDSAGASKTVARKPFPWLFSATVDLVAFLGSAVVSLLLLAVGHWCGVLNSESPEWTWLTAVLLIDVAHVYTTCWRVYFDPQEFQRRKPLYMLVPTIIFVVGWAIYSESSTWFWSILAYMAVFHFVRQQYGWVSLYRARGGEKNEWLRRLDTLTIYTATLYPLIWWHTHLPRKFAWMVKGNFESVFAQIPVTIEFYCGIAYWLILTTYFGCSAYRAWTLRKWNPGKDIVVLTTALCWYIGIITFNSDYAFTVTNVIIHGVPYFVLVYWYRYRWSNQLQTDLNSAIDWDSFEAEDASETDGSGDNKITHNAAKVEPKSSSRQSLINPRVRRIIIFVATVWLMAYVEELFWHRGVWNSRSWLFGDGLGTDARSWLVPLLAVPQLTHYVLDGFIWKRRSNPDFDQKVNELGNKSGVGAIASSEK
jgi:hypothetical protein